MNPKLEQQNFFWDEDMEMRLLRITKEALIMMQYSVSL